MPITLSKTDFLEYLKCPKCLWLKKNRPDLYLPPKLSDFDLKNFDEGQEVDELARDFFPGGILVEGSAEKMLTETKRLINEKKSVIFQATFMLDSFIAKVDILEFDKENQCWNIYEVKSSSKINTDRDHNHLKDITFQKIVGDKTGLAIEKSYIIHLNKDYRKKGKIDVGGLFIKVDVSDDIKKIYSQTLQEMADAVSFIQTENIELQSCGCLYLTRTNHCSSFSVLNPNIPEYSVHDISRIHPTKLRNLIDLGIFNITNVPDSFELSEIQRNQVSLSQSREVEINRDNVREVVSKIKTPIYFIDYETYLSAIPLLDGFGPHQHMPFQVSIHILDFEGNLKHFEYLASTIEEAIPGVIGLMKEVISDEGSVISWHASFEGTRNKEIGQIFPAYQSFLNSINERTFDLETIFKKDYIHPGFKGKTSIKKVLPTLIPTFSYSDLDIQGGTEAMENWHKIIFDGISMEEKERIRISLLVYCRLDTLAMVEIYKHLVQKIS